jgi:glutathione S-transferase
MADPSFTLYGALGSPYSMKMRALMRYRRIPFTWVMGPKAHAIAQTLKAPVIPVLAYPDGTVANDSTALIYDLEARFPGNRSGMPADPGLAFLAFLIEDFADEWLTKAMFAYRWLRPRDQDQMSHWLAFDTMAGGGVAAIDGFADGFKARQVGRMPMVGCTQANDAAIERSTRAVLAALEAHVPTRHFLFGTRPSLAEFGLFGQLSQLGVDPTPQDMMRADYPYTYRWLAHLDDPSGIEGEWDAGDAPVVDALLSVIGAVYLPFLLANAAALEAGAAEVEVSVMGAPYRQAPFKYQVKCLAALRAAFQALPEDALARVRPRLEAAGCLAALS